MSRRGISMRRRFFSLSASVVIILSTLLIGVNLQIPNANAGAQTHDVGNLDIVQLTDYGRILKAMEWKAIPQTTEDPLQVGFIGLVIDQGNYDHTAGSEQVADPFGTFPYINADDFDIVNAITWVIDNLTIQKSICSFENTAAGTGDPNDILIEQTAWTIVNKDWAILQWRLINQKAVPLTNVCLGLELPLSQVGALYGVGWDSGDDIDGFDAVNDTYWVQDDGGTTIGFASIISTDPITHYYSEDYHAEFENVSNPMDPDSKYYKNFYADDSWLYNRIHAPNAVEGLTPGNRSSTVGWNGINIGVGSSRTFTMVIAINNSFDNMTTALKDARYYYQTAATKIILTEFSDSGGSHQIEVYNDGREPTPGSAIKFSVDGGSTFLTGNWNPDPIPTYEYAVFDVTSVPGIGAEGDTIGMYENGKFIEEVAFGLEGIAPDPLPSPLESVARRYDSSTDSYTNNWLRNGSSGSTFGSQNDVGNIISIPIIVINRVMFNPINSLESYVELMYKGNSDTGTSITGYKIVCNDEFIVPSIPNLNRTNRFFVLTYQNFSAFFTNMNIGGDNVYLYNKIGYLMDMVGWSSPHTPGYYMSRVPDGNGTYQGFNDTTSQAEGWVFDLLPSLMLTEFYADPTNTDVELYNPRGGDKVLDGRWSIQTTGGTITPSWILGTIPANGGYDYCTSPGPAGAEGDTISLYYNPGSGDILMDEVSYGTFGVAPDPLSGGSTARWWNSSIPGYSDDWTGNITTAPTWGAQNDVPPINKTPWLILDEVMFNPTAPDRGYIVIISICPIGWSIDPQNFYLVCDDVYQIPWNIPLSTGGRLILRYNDDLLIQPLFLSMDPTGDNVYLYYPSGQLYDMVGWNTAHLQGMSVRRVPDGNGTYQGHDDITSEAASWVFNTPLEVLITEISDGAGQIELYNPWYPTVDFDLFTYENDFGPIVTNWNVQTADAGQYAYFTVDASTPLDLEGDTVSFYQNGILIEAIGYGQKGITPDPLTGESVQRYWDGASYTDAWSRNWTSGPNFGLQNNVPPINITSQIVLNEVMFYPNVVGDYFVEVYNRGATARDISGYKIVCDKEFIIPGGTILNFNERFFYLLYNDDTSFFDPDMDSTGDNVYLYDMNGSLLDMVGWNTQHSIGGTVCRVPNGNGTRDGYDDVSSVAAGWRFDCSPTVSLIKIATENGESPIRYGHFESYVIYNLTVTNRQSWADLINIFINSQEGWVVEILDKSGFPISNITVGGLGGMEYIVVNITLPDSIPLAVMDNITILIRSSNSSIIGDSIVLTPKVYPFLNLTKTASPNQIYMNGTGHDEIATITLNMTAYGAQVAVRQYIDCVFCIDSSGSMGWNDPTNLRISESQNFVADNFELPDRAAIVDFDEYQDLLPANPKPPNPRMNPPAHHLGDVNFAQVIANFNDIDSAGGTLVSGGLNLSNEELRDHGQPADHSLIIILLTDADTAGDQIQCLHEANVAASMGVIIFTIGLMTAGTPFEQLLIDIANITGGMYFEAPSAAHFSAIYENISSYLADLAVWDQYPSDPNPMVRDVLPPYIDYLPGSFSIPPTNIFNNSITGETIIEWNVQSIKLGETWSVRFRIKSNQPGLQETNVYDTSRAMYYTWANTTEVVLFPRCWIQVIPPEPFPPKLYIDILPNKNDIYLYWDEPVSPGTDHYLIYNSTTPTGFDFSTPWKDTSIDIDPLGPGTAVKNRHSWNHTGAADPTNTLEYSEQWYYCIRAVNGLGEMSRSSRTVGKWTKAFSAGNGTFSLPLEPLVIRDTEFYAQDMNARFIKWMNSTNNWVQHDKGEIGDNTNVEVGKGYEIDFTAQTKYTFLGMPGAMIRYNLRPFVGFDYSTEADTLTATVDTATGNVTLNWAQPVGMDGNDYYNVYRSTTRDGFDGSEGVNYFLIATLSYGIETWIDIGAALPGTQYYYMVIPFNETDSEGATTYSIGVWTASYLAGYDTIGIPLILDSYKTTDWFCDQIDNAVGINYFLELEQRWSWHSTRMPAGAYDPTLIMTEGYQISTSAQTKYTFIGH